MPAREYEHQIAGKPRLWLVPVPYSRGCKGCAVGPSDEHCMGIPCERYRPGNDNENHILMTDQQMTDYIAGVLGCMPY